MQPKTVLRTIRMVLNASGGSLPCCAIDSQAPDRMMNKKKTNEMTPITRTNHEKTTVNVQAQRRARTRPIPSQRNAAANSR